jgi:hypothetical protein
MNEFSPILACGSGVIYIPPWLIVVFFLWWGIAVVGGLANLFLIWKATKRSLSAGFNWLVAAGYATLGGGMAYEVHWFIAGVFALPICIIAHFIYLLVWLKRTPADSLAPSN